MERKKYQKITDQGVIKSEQVLIEEHHPSPDNLNHGTILELDKCSVMLALITAFPPVFFTVITTDEGLRISLGLFIFYTLRGLIAMITLSKHGSTQSAIFLRTNQLLQLTEIPLFFVVIWLSLKLIPSCSLLTLYEYLLLEWSPLHHPGGHHCNGVHP